MEKFNPLIIDHGPARFQLEIETLYLDDIPELDILQKRHLGQDSFPIKTLNFLCSTTKYAYKIYNICPDRKERIGYLVLYPSYKDLFELSAEVQKFFQNRTELACTILLLNLEEKYQKQGIGSGIIMWIKNMLKNTFFEYLYVEANAHPERSNTKFFQKNGFEVISKEQGLFNSNDPGECMALSITNSPNMNRRHFCINCNEETGPDHYCGFCFRPICYKHFVFIGFNVGFEYAIHCEDCLTCFRCKKRKSSFLFCSKCGIFGCTECIIPDPNDKNVEICLDCAKKLAI